MFGDFVQAKRSPLLLLVRVNATHTWRRLLAVRDQSRLLTVIISMFVVGYLVLSFWLFYYALKFIAKFPGLGAVLTERLLFVLFAFLFGLLLLSNLVIGYTNLFRNRETTFLLSLPVSTQTIFRWKFIESMVLASWAFLFLIAPLLVAFGLVRDVPWHFYIVTLFLIALFIILPGVIGAWLAILVGRFLDRRNFQIAIMATGITLLAVGRVLVEDPGGHERPARQAHARGARSIADQDAFHAVPVPAEFLALVGSIAMGGGHPARCDVFFARAAEQYAVFRRHRVHTVRRSFL